MFKVAPREGADSILGSPDESEDDVFGSGGSDKPKVPQIPAAPPPPDELPATEPMRRPGAAEPEPVQPFAFEKEAPPKEPKRSAPAPQPAAPPPALLSTLVIPNLSQTAEGTAPGSAAPSRPTPSRPAPAIPSPQPGASAPANPWAGLDAMAATALPHAVAPQPVEPVRPAPAKELPEEEVEPRPAPRPRARAAAGGGGGVPKPVVIGLAVYALIMTGLAVYGLVFKSASLPPEHPLSVIPDDFGEFPAASRKKVTAFRFPLDGELPTNQRAAVGGRIEIGQLVIEPLRIEKRKLTLVRESDQEKRPVPLGEGLVLRLKVTNTSQSAGIYPLDPAFLRPERRDDRPATRIVVGNEVFAGGPINWPFGKLVTREYEQEQAEENRELAPGETRDYFVCSVADPHLAVAVRHAKEPVLWRVQVRRGVTEYKGKDVPVTAIVGVEFRPGDVAGL